MHQNVKAIPFPGIPNAYIVISAVKSEKGNGVEKRMSFFYDNGMKGAEWEPDYGPISIYNKCEKNDEGAMPHFFYEYYTGQGNWSQLAVQREGLPDSFLAGDYPAIFAVLKSWSE